MTQHTPGLPVNLRISEIIRAGPDRGANGWNPIYQRASKLADAAPEMLEALRDLRGEKPAINLVGVCNWCGRDYAQTDVSVGENCPSEDCPSYKARAVLATI